MNLIVSLLSGSAAGSAVTLAASARKDSRSARSQFLGPLSTVERARWDVEGENAWQDFREACHQLESAAIICGVSREAVETYLAYADRAFHWVRTELETGNYDEEYGPGLDGTIGTAVMAMATVARDFAWTPWRANRHAPDKIRAINRAFDRDRPKDAWTYTIWTRHYAD